MAAFSNRCPVWFITFVFSLLTVPVCFSLDQCVDGTYDHEGKTCCRCAAGQYLVEDCTKDPTDRKCANCEQGTFSSHPNNQKFCDRCTSCSHPNDNLEEVEACTSARDTKCQCTKDHYCVSGKEICKLCQPCKTCDNGVKIPCQDHNDTVCKDATFEGNQGAVIGGILGSIVVVAVAVAVLYYFKKRKCDQMSLQEKGDAPAVEMVPLNVPKDVDLQPHLHDIAELIPWKVMKEVAMRSNIQNTTIDSVQQNNPRDAQEQTLELLKIYVEHQGKKAAENLIKMLQISKHKDTAEKVARLLTASTQRNLSA